MLDYKEIQGIKKIHFSNKNIMEHLRRKNRLQKNSSEIIQYSYDLQAGEYYSKRLMSNLLKPRKEIAKKINDFILNINAKSVLEAGVGDGNTLSQVLLHKNELRSWIHESLKAEEQYLEIDTEALGDEILVLMDGAIILSQIQKNDWPIRAAKNACVRLLS